jgi:hypothetical protein
VEIREDAVIRHNPLKELQQCGVERSRRYAVAGEEGVGAFSTDAPSELDDG